MELEKTKLWRFAAFIKILFRAPGNAQADTENEMNNFEAKQNGFKSVHARDASAPCPRSRADVVLTENETENELCSFEIDADENFKGEDAFGKTETIGDSLQGLQKLAKS